MIKSWQSFQKPDMQTSSEILKRTLFLAKRALPMWRRGAAGHTTLTARPSRKNKARDTLGLLLPLFGRQICPPIKIRVAEFRAVFCSLENVRQNAFQIFVWNGTLALPMLEQ
jgi:hypothetical protein